MLILFGLKNKLIEKIKQFDYECKNTNYKSTSNFNLKNNSSCKE